MLANYSYCNKSSFSWLDEPPDFLTRELVDDVSVSSFNKASHDGLSKKKKGFKTRLGLEENREKGDMSSLWEFFFFEQGITPFC